MADDHPVQASFRTSLCGFGTTVLLARIAELEAARNISTATKRLAFAVIAIEKLGAIMNMRVNPNTTRAARRRTRADR